MALIVEDGTGLATAESYLSLPDADAYHLAFGNSTWDAATDAAKEAALRRATQYLDSRYTFAGQRLTTTQTLEWPRAGIDLPSVRWTWPVKRVQDACAELALRALSGSLTADQPSAQTKSEEVGPVKVEYFQSAQDGQTRYLLIDDMLRGLLTAGSGRLSLRLERA